MVGKISFVPKKEEIVRKFLVSKKEEDKKEKWLKKHRKKCNKKFVTYCFTYTGIGIATVVRCECGEEIDITDYGRW